jgi:hypothetical protein
MTILNGAAAALLVTGCILACGSPMDSPASGPTSMAGVAGDGQAGPVANALPAQPVVVVRDAAGRPLAGVRVGFIVTEGGGWVSDSEVVTDQAGRAATTWYLGPRPGAAHRLTATAGTISDAFSATATPLVPGTSYLGAHGYIEMIAGELPIIISAPHGGSLEPASIPTRTGANVTTVRDANTEELAREIAAAYRARTGSAPTIVICRLHRRKLDANREIVEAAQGNAAAERAWREYHAYIEAARAAVMDAGAHGVYIDLHGHGHEIQRLELGYLLTGSDLASSDAALNTAQYVNKSSLRALVASSGATHAELVRGPLSLGTLFEEHGFPAVPSLAQPHPAGAPYFSGGYNTSRHSSRDGTLISGLQIEANMTGVRNSAANRERFAEALFAVLGTFMQTWHPAGAPAVTAAAPAAGAEAGVLQSSWQAPLPRPLGRPRAAAGR